MGWGVGCLGVPGALFAAGGGWPGAIPAVGALVIPYFAVVFANGGREPTSTRGFRAYEPNLPQRYSPTGHDSPGSPPGPGQPGPNGSPGSAPQSHAKQPSLPVPPSSSLRL